jgi:glycosyltransferase involved in cell wall biosynthesis
MTILFDLSAAQPIYKNDFHGGSEYCKTVFISLCEKRSADLWIDVFYNFDKYLDSGIKILCEKLKLTAFDCKNKKDIEAILSREGYNLFYSTLPYSYIDIVIPEKTKFIYTIHGLRSLEYPWDRFTLKYRKLNTKILIKHIFYRLLPEFFICFFTQRNLKIFSKLLRTTKNQNVVTVSNHSRYSLSYFFPGMTSVIVKTFYSPQKQIVPIQSNEENVLSFYAIKREKYIFMICGDRSEKGAYRACAAIVKLFGQNSHIIPKDLKIVTAGITYDRYYRKLVKNSDKFIFLDYISPEHLEILYKNAHLFLYPTMNEGFGYPPLEAMKYGTLCACSANSSITEVCSDAVLYFNPFDEVEIGIRILESFDTNIVNVKQEKMRIQYNKIHTRQKNDLEKLIQFLIGRDNL